MGKQHQYKVGVTWTGNKGQGTCSYIGYDRSHSISVESKPDICASSDPAFRGDSTKHNPEELLVASISACHMLWYLHLCASAGIIVIGYTDNALGTMAETENGGGPFIEVILYPNVTVKAEWMIGKANKLHEEANKLCFIANSLNFKVRHLPTAELYSHS